MELQNRRQKANAHRISQQKIDNVKNDNKKNENITYKQTIKI